MDMRVVKQAMGMLGKSFSGYTPEPRTYCGVEVIIVTDPSGQEVGALVDTTMTVKSILGERQIPAVGFIEPELDLGDEYVGIPEYYYVDLAEDEEPEVPDECKYNTLGEACIQLITYLWQSERRWEQNAALDCMYSKE